MSRQRWALFILPEPGTIGAPRTRKSTPPKRSKVYDFDMSLSDAVDIAGHYVSYQPVLLPAKDKE